MSKAAQLAALIGGQKALGHKNLVKNGAMVVAQRATSATGVTTSGINTVDRMNPDISSAGTWTQSQSTEVPSGQGFVNSFKLDCTTADASLSASNFFIFGYRMEGLDLQRLNYGTSGAKNIVLSFWVKTNKTGNYVVQMQNQRSTNKVCSLLYTVSSANTWQKVEFPIPADTAAAFDNDNGMSAILYWWLAAGTDWTSGTLNTTWGNITNANLSAGLNVNLADSTSNEWYITGIQLEEGEVATPFEHEDIGTTLRKCQRYYQQEVVTWILGVEGTRNSKLPFPHKVSMRAAPTSALTGGSAAGGTLLGTVDVTSETTNFHFWKGSSGSLANATFSAYTFKATAEL